MSLPPKYMFVIYSPCATAAISLMGSCSMLLTLFRSRHQVVEVQHNSTASGSVPQASKTYDRLVTGIAISDIIMSSGMVVGPLLIPEETEFPGARGTQTTCTLQAVLLQLGMATFPYSFMLMLYYLLVIRYNVKEKTISTRIEPFMHFIPIAYHVSTVIIGLVWGILNFTGSICWVAARPLGCNDDDGDIECEKQGHREYLFGNYLLVVPFIIWTGLLVFMLAALTFTVWQKHRQARRFVFRGSQGSVRAAQETRQVTIQCLLYAVTFTNCTIWNTWQNIYGYFGKEIKFWVTAVGVTFFPLQGLFNFLIFIRPRYIRKRELHKDKGRFFALGQAVWNPISPRRLTPEQSSNSRPNRDSFLSSSKGGLPVKVESREALSSNQNESYPSRTDDSPALSSQARNSNV